MTPSDTNSPSGPRVEGQGPRRRGRGLACSALGPAALGPLRAVLLSFFVCTAALAQDAVKLSNLWIENVQVEGIDRGTLTYTTADGAPVERPLANLQAMRLKAFPELAQAVAALEKGDDAGAVPLLAKVTAAAERTPWAKHYAQSLAMAAHDRLGRPVEAVDLYLALLAGKADPAHLAKPPLKSVAAAGAEQKKAIEGKLTAAASGSSGPAADAIKKMLEQVKAAAPTPAPVPAPASPTPAPATPATPTPTPATPAPGVTPAPGGAAKSAVVLAKEVPADDAIAALLREGKFQAALDAATEALSKPSMETSLRLYERGVAQLGLADAATPAPGKGRGLYLDAGLSFMRVVIHFPKSQYAGPALVEAGYVHRQIGRPDLAAKLWDKARQLVTDTEDPEIHARLERISAGAGAGDAPADASGSPG